MKERIREEIQRKSLEDEKWRRYYKDMEKPIYPLYIVFVEIF